MNNLHLFERAGAIYNIFIRILTKAGVFVVFSGIAVAQNEATLAIENISVIDLENSRVINNQTILIRDSSILSIGASEFVDLPDLVFPIDGRGLYAMAGLSDMHVHLEEQDIALFLANGITTVREMNGTPEILKIRSDIQSGRMLGPTIYLTGPLLAGEQQNWRHTLISNPNQAVQEIEAEYQLGYDFIKVYDGLSREAYEAIVNTAAQLKIPLVGHIPAVIGLNQVLLDDFQSIEHVEQLARAVLGHDFDESRILDIVSLVSASNTAITPTLAVMEILNSRRSLWFEQLYERDEMKYAPVSIRDFWQSLRQAEDQRASLAGTAIGGNSREIEFYRKLTLSLAEAGVQILVGTDTPNPLLVPGYSLLHELESLVRAGISPSSALLAATKGAASHLQAESEFGSLKEGLRADIVILGDNPILNLAALRDIHGVVVRGVYLGADEIAAMLMRVEQARSD